MAEKIESTVNDIWAINSTLSAKNFATKTLASTDKYLQYESTHQLEADSDPVGSYWGVIVVIEAAFDTDSVDLIADNAGFGLVEGDGTGKLKLTPPLGFGATSTTSTSVFIDGVRRKYVFATAGFSGTQFNQIWADGVNDKEDSTLNAGAATVKGYTAINKQEVVSDAAVYITEPVESQADLTALIEQAIAGF